MVTKVNYDRPLVNNDRQSLKCVWKCKGNYDQPSVNCNRPLVNYNWPLLEYVGRKNDIAKKVKYDQKVGGGGGEVGGDKLKL